MANTNISRYGEINQKKVTRLLSVHLSADTITAAGGALAVGANNFFVATLPEKSVLVDAYVVTDTPSNAATSAVIKVGTAEGGAQIMADVDAKAAAGVSGELVAKLKTDTGMPIYAAVTYTGATTNFGDFTIVIRYDEYTKKSGEYTRIGLN